MLKLDVSKAEWKLGWHSKIDPKEAIMSTINWYLKFETEQNSFVLKHYSEIQLSELTK